MYVITGMGRLSLGSTGTDEEEKRVWYVGDNKNKKEFIYL